MIDQVFERENYVIAKKLLDVSHSRHQAIAGNLANVETPGFKRKDLQVDFASQLEKLAETNDVQGISKLQPTVQTDFNSPSVRADGNNVQMDQELLEMNKNSVQYDFLTYYTANSLKRIKTAITGRTM